jgi:hypothetical protein
MANSYRCWYGGTTEYQGTEMTEESKIAIFIDGANLYATSKSLGFDIRRSVP